MSHKALKLIARGKLTLDDRVVLHRVAWQAAADTICVYTPPPSYKIASNQRLSAAGVESELRWFTWQAAAEKEAELKKIAAHAIALSDAGCCSGAL